jgi:hypothetical protein
VYDNYSCAHLPEEEAYYKGEEELYVPISFVETISRFQNTSEKDCLLQRCQVHYCRLDTDDCLCQCRDVDEYFVLNPEHVRIGWDHHARFTDPRSGLEQTARSTAEDGSLLTILRYHEEEKLRFISPQPQDIRLEDLLLYAGIGLDDENTGVTGNLHPNKTKNYPILRTTGFVVTLNFDFRDLDIEGHSGTHLCYIDVEIDFTWASKQAHGHGQPLLAHGNGKGDSRFRYMYGVRIIFKSTGTFHFRDLTGLFVALASFIVYVTVPTYVIAYFSAYMLGPLSEIYYKCQFPSLHIGQSMCSLGMRLAAMNTAYDQLTMSESRTLQLQNDGAGVSKKQLCHEFVKAILPYHDTLDESEIAALCEMVFDCLSTDGKVLSRNDFVTGGALTDAIAIQDVATLFDSDRRKCLLESIFTERKYVDKKTIRLYRAQTAALRQARFLMKTPSVISSRTPKSQSSLGAASTEETRPTSRASLETLEHAHMHENGSRKESDGPSAMSKWFAWRLRLQRWETVDVGLSNSRTTKNDSGDGDACKSQEP